MNEQSRIAKSLAQKRATRCRHFNGVQHDTCGAGVCYAVLEQTGLLPCLPHHNLGTDKPVAKCEKFERPTPEELAKRAEAMARHLNGMIVARDAIMCELRRRWKEGPTPQGVTAPRDISRFCQPQTHYYCGAGVMDCPVCKTGKLRYSRAEYNGHIHAACSTPDCVRWME